ncbi:MAG: lysophospholipid acyltransferase family protein [Candidatus Puniceispirillaceae bacterium]
MSHYNKPFLWRKFIEIFLWPLQGVIVFILVSLIRLLPVSTTSFIFGKLVRFAGPMTTHHQRARRHIRFAMPELSEQDITDILPEMWEHLGRVAGEYPHIHKMGNKRYATFHGLSHLENNTQGGFIIGGHIGNWEMQVMISAYLGHHFGIVYRRLNNPFANWVLDTRFKRGSTDIYPKGQEAARGMLKTIRKKGMVHLISDQKLREGVMAPFFGHPASTPASHIKIALKQKIPIFYVRAIRRKGCHFDIHISPPHYIYTDGKVTDELVAHHAAEMNKVLSDFIKQTPEQWLWPHRRWGKDI